MGTNYYAHLECCDKCGRADIQHIGKSSIGWTFSFHAVDNFLTLEINSWEEWKEVLKLPTTKIIDEYGQDVSFESFEKLVETKKSETHNHTAAMLDPGGQYYRQNPNYYESNYFYDSEGNSFSRGEFL